MRHSTRGIGLRLPNAVRTLLVDAGIQDVEVVAEKVHQPLRTADDFWTMALGTGLRWTIDEMGDAAKGVGRDAIAGLTASGVDRLETNAIYAVARV
jgi:hypothetical protein